MLRSPLALTAAVTGLAGVLLVGGGLAIAQFDNGQLDGGQFADGQPLGVILHEPLPGEEVHTLTAGRSDAPVFVYEEGEDPDALPVAIRRDGMEIPAPEPEDSGDDLLYRTADPQATPEPGTVHNVQNAVRPDRETAKEPWLRYHAVFDPAIIPFKRNSAKDRVTPDGTIVTGQPELVPEPVRGNRASTGRELFWGSVLLQLQAGTVVPLPSVSPESRILSYETVPETKLTFFKDGADNFFADGGDFSGRVRVNFVMDAPITWFSQAPSARPDWSGVPEVLRPQLPEKFLPDVRKVERAIGIEKGDSYADTLAKLVYWFRSFAPGELPEGQGELYLELALGQKGVCRHRAYAFVITAHGLGIPARYVANEAHVFVEVFIPGGGWLRIDLGGGAEGMDVRNGQQKTRHSVSGDDPFGFPPGFSAGYSQRALEDDTGAEDGSDPVRGLPPRSGQLGGDDDGLGTPFPAFAPGGLPTLGGLPRNDPGDASKTQTRTTLDQVSAQVYRGDKLRLQGQVVDDGETPVRDGVVRILLMDTERKTVIAELGSAKTLPNGMFVSSVVVPRDVDLGTWEVVAEYRGDADRAGSWSE